MKKFLVLALLAMTATGYTQDSSPYGPDLFKQIRKLDEKYAGQNGQQVPRIARATYDPTVQGGTSGSSYGLGVYLPAKAIIRQSWFYIATRFVDDGTGTVALKCEDANNIFSAADISAYTVGDVVPGVQTGVASAMGTGLAAECEITASVAAVQSAGKLILFVEYLVLD